MNIHRAGYCLLVLLVVCEAAANAEVVSPGPPRLHSTLGDCYDPPRWRLVLDSELPKGTQELIIDARRDWLEQLNGSNFDDTMPDFNLGSPWGWTMSPIPP